MEIYWFGFVIVFLIGYLIYYVYLSSRGEVVGALECDRLKGGGSKWANISVRRIGRGSDLPIVQFHASVLGVSRLWIWDVIEANQFAKLLESVAGAKLGKVGEVQSLEVQVVEDPHSGQALPGIVWHERDGDIIVALSSDQAEEVAKWLRLGVTRGRTLTIAKVNLRRGSQATDPLPDPLPREREN